MALASDQEWGTISILELVLDLSPGLKFAPLS